MTEPIRERHLSLPNLFNMRDLGGYPTVDGARVRWRRLFRADGLHRLGEVDRRALIDLGIRTVVDLRRPEEVELQRFDADGVVYHHVSVQPAIWDVEAYDPTVGAARFLADRYLDMARERGEQLGTVLRLIASEEAIPLAFHCLAGKDRTGVVAALTLSLLGVPDAVVADDYSLSSESVSRWLAWVAQHRPEVLRIVSSYPDPWRVSPPEAITTFLSELRATYGSVPAYAASVGVDDAVVSQMRALLLESDGR